MAIITSKTNSGTSAIAGATRTLTVTAVVRQLRDFPEYDVDTNIKPAVLFFMKVVSGAVKITWDETSPSGVNGIPLGAGDWISLEGKQNVANFQIVRDGAADAIVSTTIEEFVP